jgi:hypothetical protein
MAVLDPVSPFLALIDRLISLIQARKTRRREYFEKIIDPLYTQFVPLGEDYLNLFRQAHKTLDGPKKGRKKAVADLKAKRDEFAAARAKLRGFLKQCEKHSTKKKEEELTTFLNAMLRFFSPRVESPVPSSLGRQTIMFFDLWAGQDRRSETKSILGDRYPIEIPHVPPSDEMLRAYVADASATLEAGWSEIGGRYMDLKLKYVAD